MQQEHTLDLLGGRARIQSLNSEQASLQVQLAQQQIDMLNTRDGHLSRLSDLNDIEMGLAVAGAFAGASQGLLGTGSAALGLVGAVVGLAGVVAAPETAGTSLIASGVGAGLSVVSAGVGLASAGVSAGSGLLSGVQGIFNVYKQGLMIDQQLELLRKFEIPDAQLNEQIAQLQRRIATRQAEIGKLEIAYAKRVLTYLSSQLLNADMYSFLARVSKQHYRQYLSYATHAALMAERALEVERGSELGVVKLNYFDVSVQGLMGGEALRQDLSALEYRRMAREEDLIYPRPKVISLAQTFPLEFENFRSTGALWFRTTHLDFDRVGPGQYHRRIRSVRMIPFALSGPEGIHTYLSQVGPSEIVSRKGNEFTVHLLPGKAEYVPLAPGPNGSDLSPLNPDNDRLNVFEGAGVAASWLFHMPQSANRIDYRFIADVYFVVEYSARYDPNYHRQVHDRLASEDWRGSRVLSFQLERADALYHLHNPGPSTSGPTSSHALNMRTVTFQTQGVYPPNEGKRRLDGIGLGFFDREGTTLAIDRVRIAASRHLLNAWRNGRVERRAEPLDTAVEPEKTRVLRGGELVTVDRGDVRSGETNSQGAWVRVIRDGRLVWVPEGNERDSDRLLDGMDFTAEALPEDVPADLLRLCQVPISAQHVKRFTTGEEQRYFDVRVRDAGLPPRAGKQRVLRDSALMWIADGEKKETDTSIPSGLWLYVLEEDGFAWKEESDSNKVPATAFSAEDTWYLTVDPEENPRQHTVERDGVNVLDFEDLENVIWIMNYSYRLLDA